MKLKKGDQVVVLSGVDKGKTGKIVAVLTKENRVVLEGEGLRVNKVHQKPSQANPDGGIVEKAATINASNVMLVVGKEKTRSRVGYKTVTEKASKKKNAETKTRKVRYAKKTGEQLD
ncbi:MAG: 50S ribosomal protein L24 [Gammaproteobacteria bacterium]|nr:50S ribosomal protein L24 [Gammaproteobacteria bacterium]